MALGVTRRGHDILRLGRIEGQHDAVGKLVCRGRVDHVPGLLAGARLDHDAAHELGIGGTHIVDLDAGCLLEDLPQRQAFLLVGRGIDGNLPLGLGGGEQGGVEPRAVGGGGLRLRGRRQGARQHQACGHESRAGEKVAPRGLRLCALVHVVCSRNCCCGSVTCGRGRCQRPRALGQRKLQASLAQASGKPGASFTQASRQLQASLTQAWQPPGITPTSWPSAGSACG